MSLAGEQVPAVTVVVPCFQHGHYLGECLGSLVAQTRTDWEAVVVDDASPDSILATSAIRASASSPAATTSVEVPSSSFRIWIW